VGDAFTLITTEELDHVRAIERFIGQTVPRVKLENFRYDETAAFRTDAVAGSRRAVVASRTARGGWSFAPSGRRRR
jgi:ATP-dependent RNA helicase RhlE